MVIVMQDKIKWYLHVDTGYSLSQLMFLECLDLAWITYPHGSPQIEIEHYSVWYILRKPFERWLGREEGVRTQEHGLSLSLPPRYM